jgi:hypothetical protein
VNSSVQPRFGPWFLVFAALSAAGLTALGLLADRNPHRAFRLVAEDGALEWSQALLLGATAALLFGAAWFRRGRLGWLLAAAAIGFLLTIAEEISWGQRLFGIQTPEAISAINRQKELTLHNLVWLHGLRHLAPIGLAAATCVLCAALGFGLWRPKPGGLAEFLLPHPMLGFQVAAILVPYASVLFGAPQAWMSGANIHPHADWRLASEAGEYLFYFSVFLHALTLFARARLAPRAVPASR